MARLDGASTLPGGRRVRLRLPHRFDVRALRALCTRVGADADDLTLHRALRFDPREGIALVATILVGRSEEIVALGVMRHGAEAPDLLYADEELAPGVRALMESAMARSVAWP